jgi:hypothetical protein
MHHSKVQLIVGGGIGLFAFLGVALSFLRPSALPLEERVDAYFARAAGLSTYEDVPARIATLEGLVQDARFDQLPEPRRAQVETVLNELRDYQTFVSQVAQLPAPNAIRSEQQLEAARAGMATVDQLPRHPSPKTEAGWQYGEWRADLQALEAAVSDTRRSYLQVVDAGQDVLRHDDAPQLPQRARQVLDRAAKLPEPERDATKPVPNSQRVQYGQVFQFAGVQEALRDWAKVRNELKKLTLAP